MNRYYVLVIYDTGGSELIPCSDAEKGTLRQLENCRRNHLFEAWQLQKRGECVTNIDGQIECDVEIVAHSPNWFDGQ